MRNLLLALSLIIVFEANAQINFEKQLQKQLILAEDGDTIKIPEGQFQITKSLSLMSKKNICLMGAGMEKSILDFTLQTEGAEGLRVSDCSNVTLLNFGVVNAKGDAIKTMNVNGITFKSIKTIWTGKPKKENGAYGLYPVQCDRVIIDSCMARGASDAGIYVGQSTNIVVKNCTATENVAGIEIENSTNAEVVNNHAFNNTGGILVFDLPDLQVKKGKNCWVHHNLVENNNYPNFAPKANIVGLVPNGTGMLILAADKVKIEENKILNNRTLGVGVISYYMSEKPINDKQYYPYPVDIEIVNNTFERKSQRATSKRRMGKMYFFKLKFGKNVPHIQWDGIADKDSKKSILCFGGNTNESYANLDAENGFKNISRDNNKQPCLK